MKTDRELLELAAKAAGYQLKRMCDPVESGEDGSDFFHLNGRYWNPVTDDGDALRLAVTLGIRIGFRPQEYADTPSGIRFFGAHAGDDANARTRRAIVRAAAEIGEAME